MAKRVAKKVKFGLAGAPIDQGYSALRWYFQTELEKQDYIPLIKEYVKKTFDRKDAAVILSNPDYSFNFFNYASMIYWLNLGFEVTADSMIAMRRFFDRLLEEGAKLHSEAMSKLQSKSKPISPVERLRMKVQETIFGDIDIMLDDWMDSKRTSIDVYNLVKKYDIKGAGITYIEQKLQRMFDEYDGAYNKTDEQLVEGYSYLKRPDIKWFRDECQRMLNDVQKLNAVRKASRTPKTKKVQTADKQVAKVQYKVNDAEYKLESINPVLIVGSNTAYFFNTKSRRLQVYIAEAIGGLQVSRSSIKGYSETQSYAITLRKPDEVLQKVLTLTPAKVKKLLEEVKAKKIAVSGRLNTDTIILRAVK